MLVHVLCPDGWRRGEGAVWTLEAAQGDGEQHWLVEEEEEELGDEGDGVWLLLLRRRLQEIRSSGCGDLETGRGLQGPGFPYLRKY